MALLRPDYFAGVAKYPAGCLDFAKSRVPTAGRSKIVVGKIQTTCRRVLHPRQNIPEAAVWGDKGEISAR